MKKILITGANSYIGTSFENYINNNFPGEYVIDTLDMLNSNWHSKSFEGYDSVFHVAGIAHSGNGKTSKKESNLYYAVNTDLAINVAAKAKSDGVKQFVFMSSSIVYGDSATIGKSKVITKDTPVNPTNSYGDSKVKAEVGISCLTNDSFKVVIMRTPMVYGENSKGNYALLAKIAKKIKIFPYIKNERSMIYIDNLCEFIRLVIENNENGIFWPQNPEYSNTSELVEMIAKAHGRRVYLLKGFTWLLRIMSFMTGLVNKAFGCFCYDHSISQYKCDYTIYHLEESIERIEK